MKTDSVPAYLAGADSDPLMLVMAIVIVVLVVVIGVLYFKLHAIPEHIAKGKNHTQIQLIAILTILALFTHNNIFWVGALIIAVVELPDFMTPLRSIAKSLSILADNKVATDTSKAETSEPNNEPVKEGKVVQNTVSENVEKEVFKNTLPKENSTTKPTSAVKNNNASEESSSAKEDAATEENKNVTKISQDANLEENK